MLLPAVRHELSFWHGSSRLVGDLVLPGADRRHPVVLVVTAPGVTERDCSPWLDGLAEAGIAGFTWDRPAAGQGDQAGRSAGGSLGHDPMWRVADQAREVLAALDRLRCVPELDPDAVALVGWGEGGWAAAQAVTFSSRVRALVLAGTPTLAPVRMIEHRLTEQVRAAGYPGPDVDAAREAVRRRIGAVLAGDTPAEAEALDAEHRPRAWYRTLATLEEFARPAISGLAADPRPTLSAVQVPVLALFGELDPTLPVEESAVAVRSALLAAGHEDHSVAVVRGADRALRIRPTHGHGSLIDGYHRFGEWSPALTAVLVEWFDGRIRPREDLPAFAPPPSPDDLVGRVRAAGNAPMAARPTTAHPQAAHPPNGGFAPRELRPLLPVRQVRRRISR